MLVKPLIFEDKIYELKYSIKSLMLLNHINPLNNWIMFQLCFSPDISSSIIKKIYQSNIDIDTLITDVLMVSTGDNNINIDDAAFELWYQIGVGEIGLNPSVFYNMSPVEFKLCINGSIKNKINNLNLYQVYKNNQQNELNRNTKRISIEEKNDLFTQFNNYEVLKNE